MSLCNDQDTYNQAWYTALKNTRKKEEKKWSKTLLVYSIIHLVFLIWGILIALKTPKKYRSLHVTLAIVFAPAYVLAHYLSAS